MTVACPIICGRKRNVMSEAYRILWKLYVASSDSFCFPSSRINLHQCHVFCTICSNHIYLQLIWNCENQYQSYINVHWYKKDSETMNSGMVWQHGRSGHSFLSIYCLFTLLCWKKTSINSKFSTYGVELEEDDSIGILSLHLDTVNTKLMYLSIFIL